jgi:hypothetical protein
MRKVIDLGYAHGKTPKIKNTVFLVNEYETSTPHHHDLVVWNKKGRGTMYKIKGWTKAKKTAEQYARKMGLREYQIDSPRKVGMVKLKRVI